jgi:hypothetical protein
VTLNTLNGAVVVFTALHDHAPDVDLDREVSDSEWLEGPPWATWWG